eukprot:767646-Hanusia_phi.AAC.3
MEQGGEGWEGKGFEGFTSASATRRRWKALEASNPFLMALSCTCVRGNKALPPPHSLCMRTCKTGRGRGE